MMITLQNQHISATINAKGAELTSLRSAAGIEYMWQADPAFWGKHSPVLFPIVGTLKDNVFLYKGQSYTLPRHGFARDHEFSVRQSGDNEATFTFQSNSETLKVYPFAFELNLIYLLSENSLRCTYEVKNPGTETLWFSIGGHPAFNLPLDAGLSYNDYFLEFDQEESLVRWKLEDGLLNEHTEPIATDGRNLPLKSSLFYEDAIVLKHLQSTRISLRSNAGTHGLHFEFPGFPYFGIWAAKDAPFICLEPWCGHAYPVNATKDITQKQGIEKLEPGQNWKRSWHVTCF